jgi:hypothetical protein
MPLKIDSILLKRLLPLIILFIGGIIAFYAGKSLAPNKYQIPQVDEFIFNAPAEFDIESIKALSQLKKEEIYSMLFSYPKEEEVAEVVTQEKEEGKKDVEINLTLVVNIYNKKFCRVNGRLMGENDRADGFTVKQIKERGVLFETEKGIFFLKTGEKKII